MLASTQTHTHLPGVLSRAGPGLPAGGKHGTSPPQILFLFGVAAEQEQTHTLIESVHMQMSLLAASAVHML